MILYIGNKLSRHGNTPPSVETLGERLGAFFDVVTVSDKKNRLLRLADMVSAIVRYRKRIDVVLIDTYSTANFNYAWLCARTARFFRLAYIPILRGGELENRLKNDGKRSRDIFAHSALNVAPSGFMAHIFERYGYETITIPNSIDIDRYVFKRREAVRPKLLYVRAFSKLYNPAMALRVLRRLKRSCPDAELCMVGPDRDGTLEEVKKKAEEMSLAESVRFTGKLTKEAWHTLSQEYDIFINTTNADNTPVSVIEAMALGLPVVSTNVGGIPFLLEEGKEALLVAPDDDEAMANAIMELTEHPAEARAVAEAARKKAESFDTKRVLRMWREILEPLCRKER